MNKVSVITPCFNKLNYVHECIESVQNQSYKNIEHILINDCSPENFEEIREKYQNYENIKILEMPENGGSSKARNFGIKNSEGDYILVLDSDDLIHPNCIQIFLETMNKKQNYILFTNLLRFFEKKENLDNKINLIEKRYVLKDRKLKNDNRRYRSNMFSNSIFFHKNVWNVVGGYDENIRGEEDWHYCLDAYLKGIKFFVIDKFLTYYRWTKSNKTLNRTIEQRKELTEYFIKKYKLNKDQADFRRQAVYSIQNNVEKLKGNFKND